MVGFPLMHNGYLLESKQPVAKSSHVQSKGRGTDAVMQICLSTIS